MDFLNKGYGQLADLFRSMTPGARIMAALLLAVVVVSVAYLFNQQVSGGDSYLLGGEMFSAGQLSEMHAALGKAGLEAHVDGARIKVPRGQESKYMAALAEAGALPVEFGEYLKRAVSANGFALYGAQQEARTKVAIQSELQLVIRGMKGIEKAFVHIDEEVKRGFREKNIVTASVGVQPRGNQSLNDETVAVIRSFVAGPWAGLKPEAVTVVDLSGPRLFAGTGGGESQPGGAVGSYADYKKRLELDWQEKISHLLAPMVPGALVTTNVELDSEVSNEEKSTLYNSQTPQAESRGAPPTTEKHIVREGRTPKRVTVSVAIPNTYYQEIWRRQNGVPDGRTDRRPEAAALADIEAVEKKKIEAAIFPLLGTNDSAVDSSSQVAVTTFYPVTGTPPIEPTLGDGVLAWLNQNWSTLGLTGLALVGLVMLQSMIKAVAVGSAARPTITTSGSRSELSLVSGDGPREGGSDTARARFERRTAAERSLRDELAGVVRDDPKSAVSILRTWIGNAS